MFGNMTRLVYEHLSEHLDIKFKCSIFYARCMVSAISFGLALAYVILAIFNTSYVNSNYEFQSSYIPTSVYIVLFSAVGILNFATAEIKYRLNLVGRICALFGGSVFLLYALTYVPTFSVTAVITYSIISFVFFQEAFGDV